MDRLGGTALRNTCRKNKRGMERGIWRWKGKMWWWRTRRTGAGKLGKECVNEETNNWIEVNNNFNELFTDVVHIEYIPIYIWSMQDKSIFNCTVIVANYVVSLTLAWTLYMISLLHVRNWQSVKTIFPYRLRSWPRAFLSVCLPVWVCLVILLSVWWFLLSCFPRRMHVIPAVGQLSLSRLHARNFFRGKTFKTNNSICLYVITK